MNGSLTYEQTTQSDDEEKQNPDMVLTNSVLGLQKEIKILSEKKAYQDDTCNTST